MTLQLKSGNQPGRNDPCPCGSGLKAKHCHLDPMKNAVCNRVANEKMCQLILEEKRQRGLIQMKYICDVCGKGFDETVPGVISTEPLSPCCNSPSFKENPLA
jgi:hypothetical protein